MSKTIESTSYPRWLIGLVSQPLGNTRLIVVSRGDRVNIDLTSDQLQDLRNALGPPRTVNTIETKLCKAVRAQYPSDRTAPGIVVSYLEQGDWYASVCRYDSLHSKEVVAGVYADGRQAVIELLARKWIATLPKVDRTAVDMLEAALVR